MISVIIPVYNEAENLDACLSSVLNQSCPEPFEVLPVDDGSTDGSPDIMDTLGEEHENLRVVTHPENRGYSYALNTGLKEADGDVVVFIDADCTMKENSLKRVHEAFNSGAEAFFGKVEVANEGLHPTFCKVAKMDDPKFYYGGAFMAFEKDLLVESGGFSTQGGGWSGTDDEIKARAEKNWKVHYDEEAGVYSEFPHKLGEVLTNKYYGGITYIRFKLRHPEDFDLRYPLSVGYVFALILTGALSLLIPAMLWAFAGLVLFNLARHTDKARKVARVSGKPHYFPLFYIYAFTSDIVRAIGMLTEFKGMVKLSLRELSHGKRS